MYIKQNPSIKDIAIPCTICVWMLKLLASQKCSDQCSVKTLDFGDQDDMGPNPRSGSNFQQVWDLSPTHTKQWKSRVWEWGQQDLASVQCMKTLTLFFSPTICCGDGQLPKFSLKSPPPPPPPPNQQRWRREKKVKWNCKSTGWTAPLWLLAFWGNQSKFPLCLIWDNNVYNNNTPGKKKTTTHTQQNKENE